MTDPQTTWRKSSYSSPNGGQCLEVGWIKSSYSGASGGSCVEVATEVPHAVPVRDSKVQDGPVIVLGPRAWRAFVASVKG
ncbi:DUF397 domain-containing protein [Streptomyces sp. NPDC057638]|uniref:DUF397 domain-containing protein n=1 Tax=Streptomyces sp. NPDC057638 TaxID=3346190 RepID=UPI0036CFC007